MESTRAPASICTNTLSREREQRRPSLRPCSRVRFGAQRIAYRRKRIDQRVMSELVEEDCARTTDGHAPRSPEKQLQLEGFARALAACLDLAASTGRAVDDAVIQRLRNEYAVTADEHRLVLDSLVQRREGVAAYILDAPATIEELAATIRTIERPPSPVTAFLSDSSGGGGHELSTRSSRCSLTGDGTAVATRRVAVVVDPLRRERAIADLAAGSRRRLPRA